jgi:hypothetical protein
MRKQGETGWNDLVTRSVDLGAGMLRLYGETVRDVAAGKVSYTNYAERVAAIARDEGGAYARSLTQAYLDYWGRVLDVSSDFRQRVAAGGAPSSRAAANGSATRGERAELTFTGRAGEQAVRAFVVENKQPQAVDVSFEVSEFVAAGDAARLRPDLSIEPDAFHLEPGTEQVVTCLLTLDSGFAPHRPHDALLRVMGFPGMEVAMRATVIAG